MKDGPKRVVSQSMEQPWKASEAALTVEDANSASTLLSSPKAPLRSMSHGNFRATSSSSMSVGSPAPTKRTISVVEEMETKQRENMNRKLKGLQLIAGSRSPQPKVEMPTIVDSRLAKTSALSRSTLRRDSVANYQAVTPAAFSLKGTSPATPRFSLGGPELFPLRASHSLTSLNRVYDRGLSVFVSDDYDSYSTTGKEPTENRSATGNALPRTSLSSSVRVEYLADVPLAREIKATEERVVENAIDNIFKAISHTGDDDAQYTSDYKQRSKQDGSLTSGISPAASGPPLNLKTYPKPQIPTKPANLKAFTTNGEKVLNGGNAELLNDYNQILGDFNHSSVGVAKDPSVDQQFLEPQDKTGHLARNYNTPDLYRRNQNLQADDVNRPDTRSVPQPPKASFNARLRNDLVIPYTSDPEVSEFTTITTSSRLGVVSGSRIGLQSTNATPCFISHQKMDSLLSDSNTVDSGLGRSEAAGSPGSHYQDSADELDSKGYTGWTATTAEFSSESKDKKQQPKRLTKKEFVSTAVISLSTPVTETSKVNYIEIKPTVKDNKIGSTRQSYHQETPFSAKSLRGTPQFDDVQKAQHQSVPSRYPYSSSSSYLSSTTPNQPTSGSIAVDSKVSAVDAVETSRPTRVSGKKSHREEGVFVTGFDVQSNQKSHSEHKKKTTTSNFDTNSNESPYASGSRYHARSQRESDATEVKRRAEDQSLQRDLHESETRVKDEPQRNRIRSKLFDDFADGRKETRTEVAQSSASNRTNQDKFFNDPLRTRTRNDVREIPEVRNDESKLFHDQRRAETRTDARQAHEVKDELLYVSRDPQFMVERTQVRQTHTNSVGFESRHKSTDTKKDEETVIQVDDGMVEIEVQLIKGLTGLGFCIEGGIDSPVGDKPITVKRLFKGESAAKGKLQPGDVIVAINGKPMSNKSHYQAWNQLKSLPEGPINLAIRRRRPLPPGTLV